MSNVLKVVLFLLVGAGLMISFELGYVKGYTVGQHNPIKVDHRKETAYYNWYNAELNVRYYTALSKGFNGKQIKSLLKQWQANRDDWREYYPNGWELLTLEKEKELYAKSDAIEIQETTPVLVDLMFKISKELNDELSKPRMKY